MIDPQNVLDFVHSYSIKREMALYAETGRPIHAWRAYYWIRQAGLPAPPWFLEYLDRCAEQMMGKEPPATPEQVADAFEMDAKGRRTTDCERLAAVQQVYALKEIRPAISDKEIFAQVAETRGVSESYVEQAYYKWFPKK
jgi:hypothetical protein